MGNVGPKIDVVRVKKPQTDVVRVNKPLEAPSFTPPQRKPDPVQVPERERELVPVR